VRVLGIGDKEGCFYHRVWMPMGFLPIPREDKLVTNDVSNPEILKGWDILYINRGLWEWDAERLVEFRKEYGFKLVVDLDDWWELDPFHIGYNAYKADFAKRTTDNLTIADLVTCTHERLAEKIRRYNKNVVVVRPALPYGQGQFEVKKDPSEKMRVVYCGSLTHEKDVDLLRFPMQRVNSDSKLKDSLFMVFSGYTDDPNYKTIADRMLHAFTCGLKIPGEIRGHREVMEYMNLYDDTDVSLIPLLPTEFNSMKSCLKILEAAASNNAVVVSKVDPYLGFPNDTVCYVDSQKDWYGYLKALAQFPSERLRFANRLREYCEATYNMEDVSKERYTHFKNLLA
jgi:hypothetical protein